MSGDSVDYRTPRRVRFKASLDNGLSFQGRERSGPLSSFNSDRTSSDWKVSLYKGCLNPFAVVVLLPEPDNKIRDDVILCTAIPSITDTFLIDLPNPATSHSSYLSSQTFPFRKPTYFIQKRPVQREASKVKLSEASAFVLSTLNVRAPFYILEQRPRSRLST